MDIVYRFDPHAPLELKRPRSNKQALKMLEQGNMRFCKMVKHIQTIGEGEREHPPMVIPVNPIQLGIPIAKGLEVMQAPWALVLGCADARVPIEHVMDCSSNDLFVVRVAGNVLGLECIGSVDYAATHMRESLQSVIVLGHTGCGAVTATVDVYLSPNNFSDIAFSHPVRTLIDRLMLSVRGAAKALEQECGSNIQKDSHYREWLITTACYLNAAVISLDLQREVNSVTKGLHVSYTVYDTAWSRIEALPIRPEEDSDSPNRVVFGNAPGSAEEFGELSKRIIQRLVENAAGNRKRKR